MATPAFSVLNPDAAGPVVVSVPHAGRAYTPAMLALMRPPQERVAALEDRRVDTLTERLARAPVLVAHAPRAWIDLNRNEAEIDPGLIDDYAASRVMLTPKVRSGLGLIPRRLASTGEIWRRRLARADVEARIESVHRPYHAALTGLLERAHRRHGIAILIDLHSMPPLAAVAGPPAPDIVIGDRFGQSAVRWAVDRIDALCRARGLRMQLNSPYAGAHILERHGRPLRGIHAVQIEIDRRRYLAADGTVDAQGTERMRVVVQAMVDDLSAAAADAMLPQAAE